MQRSFDENLALYARLLVREGIALADGQELLVFAEIEQAPLVRAVVSEAYRAGSKNVEVMWADPKVTLTRFKESNDEAMSYTPSWLYDAVTKAHRNNAARLGLTGTDPGLLGSVDPQRVATNMRAQAQAKKELSELITGGHFNWCLAGAPTTGWATKVFPGLPPDQAITKLWDAIFLTSRVFEPDPIAAWQEHCKIVKEKVAWLNDQQLDAIHFTGPGTDLQVGIVKGHEWIGVQSTAKNGLTGSPNIPTEEIFTMPDRSRVNGKVVSSKPLSVRGQIVDGIEVEFKHGIAVSAKAREGNETLQQLLSSDENAKRLGEVALVPNSCKVAQAGILFYNSLYDENAASHIAFGACYGENLKGYEEMSESDRLVAGANDSIIHVDWMIGSSEMDVDGIKADGSRFPVMRSGEWA